MNEPWLTALSGRARPVLSLLAVAWARGQALGAPAARHRRPQMDLQKPGFCLSSLVLMLGLSATAAPTFAADIWLGGEDPAVQSDKHKTNPADYMNLFRPDAPWTKAASGLTVFQISTQFVLRGDEEQLRTAMDDLKRRHIALGIELGVLDGDGVGHCGYHVEGYGSPGGVEAVARKIQRLGGQIDYVAMDEPVWFGHVVKALSDGRVGCQYGIAELVDRVATKVAVLRRSFPSIQIGDTEPINAKSGGPQSIDDIVTFENLLRRKTGTAPAFVHADVAWAITGWQPLMDDLATRLHASRVRFGIICDGDPNVGGNEAWVSLALRRCQAAAADPRTKPDDFIVQSWQPLPTKMLPETDPGALTYEAKQAVALFH
jgi:hypothetical protein